MPTLGQCFSGCIPRAPIRLVREIIASMSGANFPSRACGRGSGRALAARLCRWIRPLRKPPQGGLQVVRLYFADS